MALHFGRDTARDQLEAFRQKLVTLRTNPMDIDQGVAVSIASWALCDWVHNKVTVPRVFNSLADFQRYAENTCPALLLLKDIGNSNKHERITRYTPNAVDTNVRSGFSRDFSDDFQRSGLYVTDGNGDESPLDKLATDALNFWDNIFRSNSNSL